MQNNETRKHEEEIHSQITAVYDCLHHRGRLLYKLSSSQNGVMSNNCGSGEGSTVLQ